MRSTGWCRRTTRASCRDRWHVLGNRVLAARLRLDVRAARRGGGARAVTICCARYEILASSALAHDPQLLHPRPQRRRLHAENPGPAERAADAPARALEDRDDVLALHRIERQ